MWCWEVLEHGQSLHRTQRETPVPQGSEVLMKIKRCGVCHSDVHFWDGYFDMGGGNKAYVKDRGIIPPIVLGHEPWGCVDALGPDAKGVEVGDHYIVYPWIGCGKCQTCLDGQDQLCATQRYIGVKTAGAFASHLLVPHPRYLVRADGLDPSFAATLACSGLTAYGAIRKISNLAPDDWVVVLGCGGLGLFGISILKAMGIRNIIACDVDARKLAQAKALGAVVLINTSESGCNNRILELATTGVAAAIDFVGLPATANLGISVLVKGGRYVLCGLFGGEITLPLPSIAQRAISIVGSIVGSREELGELVALAKSGALALPPLIMRPAEDITRSLTDLKYGRIPGRVVLNIDD